MKHLFLIRHCKSSWSDESLADIDRPLNTRGVRQTSMMAEPLSESGAFKGPVFVSTARRTRQSIEGFIAGLPEHADVPRSITYRKKLYTFNHKDLLHWLQKQENDIKRLTIIGHNPALSDLARYLSDDALADLPTGAMVHLTLPVRSWQDLKKHEGRVRQFLTPSLVSYAHHARTRPSDPDEQDPDPGVSIPAMLVHNLQQIQSLEAGIRADHDPEFLHQYRISLRRSRAIAYTLLQVSDSKALSSAARSLKSIARNTGLLRDLDVFTDALAHWQQGSPEVSKALTKSGLTDFFQNWRRAAHTSVCRMLSSKSYRRNLDNWEKMIHSPAMEEMLASLSPERLEAALETQLHLTMTAAARLSHDSSDEEFHDVRKAFKHLRYLAELDKTRFSELIRSLKTMQDLYGLFQDLHMQQELMNRFAESQGEATLANIVIDLMMKLENDKLTTRADILEQPLEIPDPALWPATGQHPQAGSQP